MQRKEVLERTPLVLTGIDCEKTAVMDEVDREAKLLLGYGKFHEAAGEKALSTALAKLDIPPYPTEFVEHHKETLPKQVDNPGAYDFVKRHPRVVEAVRDNLITIVPLSALCVVVCCLVCSFWRPDLLSGGQFAWYGAFSVASATAAVIIFLKMVIDRRMWPKFDATWKRVPIKDYDGEDIPKFVLAKAVAIKKEVGGAEFFVEKLEYVPDPFLVVVFGDEEYYVEVWGEPHSESPQ